jgi:hypothetical protein
MVPNRPRLGAVDLHGRRPQVATAAAMAVPPPGSLADEKTAGLRAAEAPADAVSDVLPDLIPPPGGAAPKNPQPREDELVRPSRMPPQEELAIKVSEGLKGLTSLLSSIDERLVQQHRATELVAERLQTLPRVLEGLVEAEHSHLQSLKDLRSSLDQQGKASLSASAELGKLPTLVDTIGTRIDRQTEASSAMKTSVEGFGQSVRGLVDVSQRAHNSLITEFRRGQDDQRERLEALVDRQRRTIWVVAGLGVVVVICLIVVLSRLPR